MIRQTLKDKINNLCEIQNMKGYKAGWIWHQIKTKSAPFSETELYYIAKKLGYKPGWVKYKIEEQQPDELLYQPVSLLQNSLSLLELDVPFSLQDLKRSYKNKAFKLHPDRGGTHEDFVALNRAYQYLSANFR